MVSYKEKLHKITTFIFDVDGVLTNGNVQVFDNGEVVRNMHGKDGYAIQLAVKKGYNIVIMSGGNNNAIKNMIEKTGAKDLFINVKDKTVCYTDYIKTKNIEPEQVLFMGDDLPDHEVMQKVGLAACPQDSVPEIKAISHYISPKNGGEGCVRDVIEQVMRLQGTWEIANW